MKDYIASEWQDVLVHHQLDTFDRLWELDVPWFEEPNARRGGWSGVAKLRLTLPMGGSVGFFLKRQENHVFKTLAHPIRGQATFYREFKNIQLLESDGIPTLETAFFGQRKVKGKLQAILMTRELEGYEPLSSDQFQKRCSGQTSQGLRRKQALIRRVADVIRDLHDLKWMHDCLYPKHIFWTLSDRGEVDVRLIDLEKVKKVRRRQTAALRDLDSLGRRGEQFSRTDKLRFVKAYLQQSSCNRKVKKFWRMLQQKMQKKSSK